ncbi:hypothetical protein BABINDRAFT_162905 [Babjeviella inositovora NRRL Y-12698]|uniref:Uncharacterized protein n=1 Tax=Babjeviella inositovora NRRL Y-12698 TaxID=984486 RepID=A0A1E3QML8_9ASCO|nr:uncharacterized protein BABINDRAFT_162905 [Babjeviella inositovora NRRL Y-12698]ODQ78247.1 hypothetical protein BABINDRAFT_162905 [Babjeviella inositovora NRRL Y-12698]
MQGSSTGETLRSYTLQFFKVAPGYNTLSFGRCWVVYKKDGPKLQVSRYDRHYRRLGKTRIKYESFA